MTYKVILNFIKKFSLHNIDIFEKFKKDWVLNKKFIAKKISFKGTRGATITYIFCMRYLKIPQRDGHHFKLTSKTVFE